MDNADEARRYLFAALSEGEGHTLTRIEVPDGRRLARPNSRPVGSGQRIQPEGLSQLLNLCQSFSPFLHLNSTVKQQRTRYSTQNQASTNINDPL